MSLDCYTELKFGRHSFNLAAIWANSAQLTSQGTYLCPSMFFFSDSRPPYSIGGELSCKVS